MSRNTLQRRTGYIIHVRKYQLLNTEFTIRTGDESLDRHLDFIIHDAEQDFPVTNEAEFELVVKEDVYEILSSGRVCYSSDDIPQTIFNLQWIIHKEALRGITDRIRMHAGCGELNGRRFLVVGDKGVGKTTLMIRLLFSGFRVIGDELALIREGKATPFPRRFHIKEESMRLLPMMTTLFDSLPCNRTSYGQKMYSFSPQDAGYGWKIDEGEICAVFYLEPNHGGETFMEECPKFRMVERVMPMTFLSESADYLKIGELCRVIDKADCCILHVGNLEGAVTLVKDRIRVNQANAVV